MPRKKRTIIEETLPDSSNTESGDEQSTGPTEFDISLEDVHDTETLTRVLEEFGETEQKFKIYRGEEFVLDTDHIDESFLQKHFGGGDYRVRIFIRGKYRMTMPLKIANPLVPLNTQNGNSNNQHQADDRHSQFLEKMLLTILANKQSSSITEITEALKNVHAISGTPTTNPMDLFMKGVDFAKGIVRSGSDGDADWNDVFKSVVREVAPGFIQSLPRQNPATSPVNPMNPQQQQQIFLKQAIQQLKPMALQNADVGLVVDWILSQLHDEKYQFIYRAILTTEFATFAAFDPEIGAEPYVGWFKQLYDGLRSTTQEQNPVAENSSGETGHAGNIKDHGANRE